MYFLHTTTTGGKVRHFVINPNNLPKVVLNTSEKKALTLRANIIFNLL